MSFNLQSLLNPAPTAAVSPPLQHNHNGHNGHNHRHDHHRSPSFEQDGPTRVYTSPPPSNTYPYADQNGHRRSPQEHHHSMSLSSLLTPTEPEPSRPQFHHNHSTNTHSVSPPPQPPHQPHYNPPTPPQRPSPPSSSRYSPNSYQQQPYQPPHTAVSLGSPVYRTSSSQSPVKRQAYAPPSSHHERQTLVHSQTPDWSTQRPPSGHTSSSSSSASNPSRPSLAADASAQGASRVDSPSPRPSPKRIRLNPLQSIMNPVVVASDALPTPPVTSAPLDSPTAVLPTENSPMSAKPASPTSIQAILQPSHQISQPGPTAKVQDTSKDEDTVMEDAPVKQVSPVVETARAQEPAVKTEKSEESTAVAAVPAATVKMQDSARARSRSPTREQSGVPQKRKSMSPATETTNGRAYSHSQSPSPDLLKKKQNTKSNPASARQSATPGGSNRSTPVPGKKPSTNTNTTKKPTAIAKKAGTAVKKVNSVAKTAVKKAASKKRRLQSEDEYGDLSTPAADDDDDRDFSPSNRGSRARSLPKAADDDDDDDYADGDALYCICRKADDGSWMIGCDGGCDDWFHGKCVSIREHYEGKLVDKFICPNCEKKGEGKTTFKRKCRLKTCYNAARATAQKQSKYCSDEHGREFMQNHIYGKTEETHSRRAHQDSSPKKKRLKLKPEQVATLALSAKDAKEFKALGDAFPTPERSDKENTTKAPDGEESDVASNDDNDKTVNGKEDSEHRRKIKRELESLGKRREQIKSREEFLEMVKVRAKKINELVREEALAVAAAAAAAEQDEANAVANNSGEDDQKEQEGSENDAATPTTKKKPGRKPTKKPSTDATAPSKIPTICGFDPRLSLSASPFAALLASPLGIAAFAAHELPLEPRDESTVCEKPSKKCRQHLDWARVCAEDLHRERALIQEKEERVRKELARIKERRTVRELERQGGDGGRGGRVITHDDDEEMG